MVREYEGWSNERLDAYIEKHGLTLIRLSDVDGWKTKVQMKCTVCDHRYETIPHVIKQGSGCPKCARAKRVGIKKKAKYTTKEVIEILEKINLKLLDPKYINSSVAMSIQCNLCGKLFNRSLTSILRGFKKCPQCRSNCLT